MLHRFNRPSIRIVQALLLVSVLSLAACSSRDERAQSYYERGMTYLAKNDLPRARVELRNALQQKGDLIVAWRGLAQIEESERNWQGVAPIWRKITELDTKDLETRLKLAKLALLSNAVDEAMKLANAAVEIDPKNASAHALRAGVLLKLNDSPGATQEARRALEIDSKNSDATAVLAADRFAQNDSEGALKLLANIPTALRPDIGIALFKIRIFEKTQDKAAIERELRGLAQAYPQEKAFKTELLRFYVANQRPEEAEKELRAATADSKDTRAVLELVSFLNSTKGAAAARQELDQRIKAGGNVFPLRMALAELDFVQGNPDGAIQSVQGLVQSEKDKDNILSARIKLAEMQIARKNPSAAEPLLNDVLQADSRNVNALRLRAAIRIEQGRLEDAVADLRQALNEQPKSPELLTLLSVAFERQGSVELADKQLNDATRASNFAPATGLNYVAFLQRRGNLPQAEDVLLELATRHPNDLAVLSALAQVRLSRQNWIGAQEIAEHIRKLGDKRGVAEQIQAASLTGQQKYDDAAGLLRTAYEANPGAIQPMVALVRTYVLAKQPDKAESFLDSVLKVNPANAQARVLLGLVQLAANAPAKAADNFKTAIQQNPKDVSGYRALSDLYLRQGKPEDALQVIRAGLKEQPSNPSLRLVLAGILELKQDYDGAILEYQSLLKDDPGSLVFANNLASLLSDHRTDKASLDQAFTLASSLAKSQVSQFKDTLGWIHHLRGDHKSAIPLLEDAVKELPNLAVVRFHLGMSYLASGQGEKATEQLKKAAELTPDQNSELAQKIRAALKS